MAKNYDFDVMSNLGFQTPLKSSFQIIILDTPPNYYMLLDQQTCPVIS